MSMLKECSSDCANGVHDVSAAAALGASVALVVMSEAAQSGTLVIIAYMVAGISS